MSQPIIKFVLTAALRDKILITFLLLVLIVSSMSTFFGAATTTEQSSFAIVYMASGLRFVGVLSMILFTCFYIRRAFDTKEVEFMLSRPISRLEYVLNHAAAFMLIAAIMTLLLSLIVLITSTPDFNGWALWSFSLLIEYILVMLIALFFAMVIPSAAGAALACFGFYALGRMLGVLFGIVDMPADNMMSLVMGYIIELISVFTPRFDLMGQSAWLVYGQEALYSYDELALVRREGFSADLARNWGASWFIYLQGLGYSIVLITATAFDFIRKQF